MGIIYQNLKELNSFEISEIMNVAEQYYKKLEREYTKHQKLMKEGIVEGKLIIDLKRYKRLGSREKFSIHLRYNVPSKIVTAKHADFELNRALRRTFEDLMNALERKIKVQGQFHHNKKTF